MRALLSLIRKEFLQIIRDPSSIIIAFVLPLISIMIYMYGINLDSVTVTIAIKNDDNSTEISSLLSSFSRSKYINSVMTEDMNYLAKQSKIKGLVIIPNDFSKKLEQGNAADLMLITDGSEVNTANYLQSYIKQIADLWLSTSKYSTSSQVVTPQIRTWYNQDSNGRNFILPGSIAITMTLIGILLTALVVAREWERGTMEAILNTNITKMHIVLGKYIPYFILGMTSLVFNLIMCIGVFNIKFRGSYLILFIVSSLFLFASLGIGLLISTKVKNQFLASQLSLGIGFLPALLLSGLIFPIGSMPNILQLFTRLLPPRYYITFLESEFMAGTVWSIVVESILFLAALGSILFIAVYKSTNMRFEND